LKLEQIIFVSGIPASGIQVRTMVGILKYYKHLDVDFDGNVRLDTWLASLAGIEPQR